MRIAHVRERDAQGGTPWRLAAAPGDGRDSAPTHWIDLEIARRKIVGSPPGARASEDDLLGGPLTTLDDHLARGHRVADLAGLVERFVPRDEAERDDAILDARDLRFGPPILRPWSFRDFFAFEQHVRTTWRRGGGDVPEAWYRLPIFYFSNVSELRGPGDPVWAPRGSTELDYELEVGALIDRPARDLAASEAEAAIGGYFILNDWSARDLQRDEATVRLGPAKGKDFALSIGPWLVTPDELADVRRPGSTGPDLTMTATVSVPDGAGSRAVATSRGLWSSAQFTFGAMIERASTDVTLRPGDVLGSGTVGGGCLLEVRDTTLGRYLEPGDEVTLEIERLGSLRTPIVARPDA